MEFSTCAIMSMLKDYGVLIILGWQIFCVCGGGIVHLFCFGLFCDARA
jgi:hypothetical protein